MRSAVTPNAPSAWLDRLLFRLRRMMWDEYCNPLGLVYSLYRGTDIFLPRPIEPATPPTE